MSQTITSIFECPFALRGAYEIEVNGNPVDINDSSPGVVVWYRIAVTKGSNNGATARVPKSFCDHVKDAIAPGWGVNPANGAGKVTISRTSGGAGTIDWSTGKGAIIRDLLGFDADISLAQGTSITAPLPPAYRLLTIERRADSHWQPESVGAAYSETDGGTVSGVGSKRVKMRRRFVLGAHPTTPTAATALALPNTPVLPDLQGTNAARLVSLPEDLETTSPPKPFTVLDFWSASKGRLLSAILGGFQLLITEGNPYYDDVHLDAKTCAEGPFISLKDARWSELMDCGPWGLLLTNPAQAINT